MHRKDHHHHHHLQPPPYNLIEDGLYLGNEKTAVSRTTLEELDIQCVITVRLLPLDPAEQLENVEYHFFKAEDEAEEDMLSYFFDTYKIMTHAQERNRNIFVHCKCGVSRSPSVIIAFLMKKHKESFDDAYERVASKRNILLNHGFIEQLELFEKWNCKVDGANKEYRWYLVKNFLNDLSKTGADKDAFMACLDGAFDEYHKKLKAAEARAKLPDGKPFLCAHCDHHLFFEVNLIEEKEHTSSCDRIFIEPQMWMKGHLKPQEDAGIKCPNCWQVIGHFRSFLTPEHLAKKPIFGNTPAFSCDCDKHKSVGKVLVFKIDSKKVKHS